MLRHRQQQQWHAAAANTAQRSTGWGAGANCSSSGSGLSYLRSAVVGGAGLLQGHVAGRGMEVLARWA
jgi:hypothetical protein